MAAELRTSVDIDATPERVWRVLTDLPAYAEWNPFVTAADGDVVAGGRLSVRVPPGNALLRSHLRPTVRQVVPSGGCGCGAGWTGWASPASSTSSTP
ncbi:SRPBCC family protein [Geodermatophilus sp. SYSU D00525]